MNIEINVDGSIVSIKGSIVSIKVDEKIVYGSEMPMPKILTSTGGDVKEILGPEYYEEFLTYRKAKTRKQIAKIRKQVARKRGIGESGAKTRMNQIRRLLKLESNYQILGFGTEQGAA